MQLSKAQCSPEEMHAFKTAQQPQFRKALPARIDPDAEARDRADSTVRQSVENMVKNVVHDTFEGAKSKPDHVATVGTGRDADLGAKLFKAIHRSVREGLTASEMHKGRF